MRTIDIGRAAVTERLAVALRPEKAAVIVVAPDATPDATPRVAGLLLIVAAAVVDDDQVTTDVRSATAPLLYVPATVKA